MAREIDQEREYTTITVTKRVKEDLDEYRDGRPWSVFLEQLRKEHADPITLNDAQEIADVVGEQVGADVDKSELGLAVADYLMAEYELPRKVAEEMQR